MALSVDERNLSSPLHRNADASRPRRAARTLVETASEAALSRPLRGSTKARSARQAPPTTLYSSGCHRRAASALSMASAGTSAPDAVQPCSRLSARQPNHWIRTCDLCSFIAPAMVSTAAGTCCGSTRLSSVPAAGLSPTWSAGSSSKSMIADIPASCTFGELGWLVIWFKTTGKPDMAAEAQKRLFWCFMFSSRSLGSRMREAMWGRTARSDARQGGDVVAMCPSDATPAWATSSLHRGSTASISTATPSSSTCQWPGGIRGVRSCSTPPSASTVYTNSSLSTGTRLESSTSACAASGSCCWNVSSNGIHANFDMAARPARTAQAESAARDITCSTAQTPPTCPRVHMVWSVTLPGRLRPQATRLFSASRERRHCAA
mmetsp:Transcript_30989/g.81466  ORF Transcript_30989/g.81466 Transcript_30989/m.81466 type:complete len:378 (+) Transcript_30989:410-1543(+)